MDATERAGLEAERDGLEKRLAGIKAKLAEMDGSPRKARFYRVCSGEEQGSIHAAYLEMRAEERLAGMPHYAHESAEDIEAIDSLVTLLREAHHAAA